MNKSSPKQQITEKKERLRIFLKEKGFKSTRQRDIISTEFLRSTGHITAEDLYKKISTRHKGIGFTTVYRTLKLLTKLGLATERVFADNLTRYEPLSAEDHHDHLICISCGSIVEFENTRMERLQEKISSEFGFFTVIHKMELYGYCSKCTAQNPKLADSLQGKKYASTP